MDAPKSASADVCVQSWWAWKPERPPKMQTTSETPTRHVRRYEVPFDEPTKSQASVQQTVLAGAGETVDAIAS